MQQNKARIIAEYEVEVRDKNGKLLSHEKGICKSFVANFISWLSIWFSITTPNTEASAININDTGNSSRAIPIQGSAYQGYYGTFSGAIGVTAFGIVIGSGNTPTTISDIALTTLITHGTGAGQLVYNAQTQEPVSVVAPNAGVRATRTFTNNGSASVTAYEFGWYFSQYDTTGSQRFFCMMHDLFTTPQTVPVGATMTVRYKISGGN